MLARESSVANQAKILNTRTALLRRITNWRRIQNAYMPGVQQRIASLNAPTQPPTDTSATQPSPNNVATPSASSLRLIENTCIYLPSDLLKLDREDKRLDPADATALAERKERAARRDACVRSMATGLVDSEIRLRKAQCSDAIEALRTKLLMRTRLIQYKRINVRNQGRTTRTRHALASVQRKIHLLAAKYTAARDALKSLVGTHDDWVIAYERLYPPLLKEDIRGIEDDDPVTAQKKKRMRKDGPVPAEGRRKTSWIWKGASNTDSDEMNASEPRLFSVSRNTSH